MPGAWGSVSGQRTRSHMPQLRVHMPQRRLKIPTQESNQDILHAAAKTWHSQINSLFFFKEFKFCTKDGRSHVQQLRPCSAKATKQNLSPHQVFLFACYWGCWVTGLAGGFLVSLAFLGQWRGTDAGHILLKGADRETVHLGAQDGPQEPGTAGQKTLVPPPLLCHLLLCSGS